jgi:hypothetical protein
MMEKVQTFYTCLLIIVLALPMLNGRPKDDFYRSSDYYIQTTFGFIGLLLYGLIDFGVITEVNASKSVFVGSVILLGCAYISKKKFINKVH